MVSPSRTTICCIPASLACLLNFVRSVDSWSCFCLGTSLYRPLGNRCGRLSGGRRGRWRLKVGSRSWVRSLGDGPQQRSHPGCIVESRSDSVRRSASAACSESSERAKVRSRQTVMTVDWFFMANMCTHRSCHDSVD